MSTETSKKAPVSAEPIAYKVPSGTAFAMGISRYQDASCFGGNKAELHAAAEKHEWKPLYTAPVAAQAQPDWRLIQKGDQRIIKGQVMTCTDPEIGRWQGSGPQQPVSGADGLQAVGALVADERELVALAVKHHIRFPRNIDLVAFIDEARAAPAQQDANKVDAERYRAWRDAAVANSTPFVRAMRDTLPPEAREGKPRWPTASEWDAAIDAARKEQA